MNQVYAHGELAVDDPIVFSDWLNAACSYGGWSFPDKDQVQSVETVFEPASFTLNIQYYTNFGISLSSTLHVLYYFTSRERDKYDMYSFRIRIYNTYNGMIFQKEARGNNKYVCVKNTPVSFMDSMGMKRCTPGNVINDPYFAPVKRNFWKNKYMIIAINKIEGGRGCECLWAKYSLYDLYSYIYLERTCEECINSRIKTKEEYKPIRYYVGFEMVFMRKCNTGGFLGSGTMATGCDLACKTIYNPNRGKPCFSI